MRDTIQDIKRKKAKVEMLNQEVVESKKQLLLEGLDFLKNNQQFRDEVYYDYMGRHAKYMNIDKNDYECSYKDESYIEMLKDYYLFKEKIDFCGIIVTQKEIESFKSIY